MRCLFLSVLFECFSLNIKLLAAMSTVVTAGVTRVNTSNNSDDNFLHSVINENCENGTLTVEDENGTTVTYLNETIWGTCVKCENETVYNGTLYNGTLFTINVNGTWTNASCEVGVEVESLAEEFT